MPVSPWGLSTYGQPCRGCAFEWELALDQAAAKMSALADSYREVLRGATGREQHPDLSWTTAAYVSHVGDNLRIWTERLQGVALGGSMRVGLYDENELARARNYDMIPLPAALWSLQLSVEQWVTALAAGATERNRDDSSGAGRDGRTRGCRIQRPRCAPSPLGRCAHPA